MPAMTIKSVGILGSGIMGSGIAEVAAKTGHTVVLRSRKQESADAMVAALTKSLAKQVDRGKLSEEDRDAATTSALAGSIASGRDNTSSPRAFTPRRSNQETACSTRLWGCS